MEISSFTHPKKSECRGDDDVLQAYKITGLKSTSLSIPNNKETKFLSYFFSASAEFLFQFEFEFLFQFGFHPYFYGCSHVFRLPARPLLGTW
jgi:hypothetical protein